MRHRQRSKYESCHTYNEASRQSLRKSCTTYVCGYRCNASSNSSNKHVILASNFFFRGFMLASFFGVGFFFFFHYAASSRRGRGSAVALCCVRRHLASFCCFVKQGVEEKMTVTFVFVISWRYFVVMKPRKEAFSHLLCLSSVVQIMFRGTSK